MGLRKEALYANLGKVPPQDVKTEESILGAILLEKEAMGMVADILKPEDFYKESNMQIYKICIGLYAESQPIDIITVTAAARKAGTLEIIGGAFGIADLTTSINSGVNIELYARIVTEMSMRRELISKSMSVTEKAYDDSIDIFDLVGKTDQEINDIIDSRVRGSFSAIGDTILESVMSMYENKDQELTGVPSGFTGLDRITGGWQNANLIIIAGRPAMGKTAFCVSFMLNAVREFKMPVGFFSLEMSKKQLEERILSSECSIELDKIRKPKDMADYEWDTLNQISGNIKDYPLYIDETPSLSIIEFKTKARRMKSKHGVKMIVVDYLQLMSGDNGGNREQEIGSISRSLKAVAKELDIPIIALSQLSRAVESRGGDKKPMLSDLRESGSIEQDADMVLFLYRPEYYGIQETEDGMPLAGKGMTIVAKNRQGATDEVYLQFVGRFTRWQDDINTNYNNNQFPI